MSQDATSHDGSTALAQSLDHTARFIEDITGRKPLTCPWRAFYDPLVQEIVQAHDFAEEGNLSVYWGDDIPAAWLDALHVYRTARKAARSHWMQVDAEKRKRERNKG